MMKAAAPLALTGLLGLIVLEVLQIVMAPLALWIVGILMVALKIGLIVAVVGVGLTVLAGVAYFVKRTYRARNFAAE